MKKLFLSLIVLMCTIMLQAQNTLVATLTHGEDVTMFYGMGALKSAMAAADHGDLINLSGGTFEAVDITKAVTLRGSGMNDSIPTVISNEFKINVDASIKKELYIEGVIVRNRILIYEQNPDIQLVKNKFHSIYMDQNSAVNMALINCVITDSYKNEYSKSLHVDFINCCIYNIALNSNSFGLFKNCYINTLPLYIKNSTLYNCIIYAGGSGYDFEFPSTCTAYNCYGIQKSGNNLFQKVVGQNNVMAKDYSIFKTFTGTYSDTETFELTEEAAAQYLGTDGTQIGINGGLLPFNKKPTYPQITKLNVAPKTTNNGMLNVEVEVSTVE